MSNFYNYCALAVAILYSEQLTIEEAFQMLEHGKIHKRISWTEEDLEIARELRLQNMTWQQVGEKMGMNGKLLYDAIKRRERK